MVRQSRGNNRKILKIVVPSDMLQDSHVDAMYIMNAYAVCDVRLPARCVTYTQSNICQVDSHMSLAGSPPA